jgi:hypothetical protein
MSLGLVPGLTVKVHQTYPAVIVKVEETQVALEQGVAHSIYVRTDDRTKREQRTPRAGLRRMPWRHRWGLRRGSRGGL